MRLLPTLAVSSLVAFAAAVGASAAGLPRQFAAHLAFAVGAMPLIFAAMGHFVPVLTRSGEAPPMVRAVPLLALAGGLGVVVSFVLPGAWLRGPSLAAVPALVAAAAMIAWSRLRGRGGLGRPHAGLWWYPAACLCLFLALLAVPAMEIWPGARAALRLFHLHLNTLGFIGLTAIGTLQVLLPTAAGRPDPQAAPRLRRDLAPALAGVLLMAGGAAWGGLPGHGIAGLGLLCWLVPLVRLGTAWFAQFPGEILRRDGAAPSLASALAGLLALSLLGGLHGLGVINGVDAIPAWFLAFLLPLVSGAVSQLLPVWRRPGRQGAWHAEVRRRLQRHGGIRGPAFVLAGLGYALGWHVAGLLALPALAQFLWALARLPRFAEAA